MRIGIVGAGNIGLYIGARLLAAKSSVVFFGRQGHLKRLQEHGLRVNGAGLPAQTLSFYNINYQTDFSQIEACDVLLVTAKTTHLAAIALDLKAHLKTRKVILTLQNGVESSKLLKQVLPEHDYFEGLVTFNVIVNERAEYFQATDGPVVIDAKAPAELLSLFGKSGIDFRASENMLGYKWSKLLLNLNNAVNALSGLPIKSQLENRSYRKVLAQTMDEGINATKAAGIRLEKLAKLPHHFIPGILRLPTPLFKVVASSMIKIDPTAKSSMLMDFEARNKTEIDFLNQQICALATKVGTKATANQSVVDLIKKYEGRGSPNLAASELTKQLN